MGTLAVVEGRLSFWYAPEWLARSTAIPLSYSLPLRTEPFDDRVARPFFAGLLPDGDMRRFIAQRLQVSRQNDFALLDSIGGECAGAVTFLHSGQNEGGPDLVQCFDLVRRVTRPSAPHVLRLLDYVIFNALIGNHDAHAKNFSLLYIDKNPVLAPLYDALSTAVYPSLTPKMAMKLGSKYKFSEVEAWHWDQFAQAAGLSMAQTCERVLDLARKLPLTACELASMPDNEFHGHPLVEQIISLIEQRSALTVRRLMNTML